MNKICRYHTALHRHICRDRERQQLQHLEPFIIIKEEWRQPQSIVPFTCANHRRSGREKRDYMQQIKTMEPAQVGEVCRIGRQNFTHPWSEQDYMEHLKDDERIYLVAECEGDVAGSCVCSFETADLCNVTVDERCRRRGLAEALLREAFERCLDKGVEQVLLEVRESNVAAIGLYEKLGFAVISRRRGYYRDPQEDALIMQKHL